MRQRIITSIVLLILIVPPVLFGGWVYYFLIGIIGLIASTEMMNMARIDRLSLPAIITYIGTISVIYLNLFSGINIQIFKPIYFQLLIVFTLLIFTIFIKEYDFTKAGISVLTMIYIGLGAHAAITIRSQDLSLFVFLILIIMGTDIGAYFIGSSIGSHKLYPSISPNKTIEGSLGGIALSLLISTVYLNFFTFKYSFAIMLLFTVVLSVTGQLGDLLASSYKRHFSVKDSGKLLPGHGGVLDRVDSTLFTLGMAMILGIL